MPGGSPLQDLEILISRNYSFSEKELYQFLLPFRNPSIPFSR